MNYNDSLPDYAVEFLNYLEVTRNFSGKTTENYASDIKKFLKFIKAKNNNEELTEDKFESINVKDVGIEVLQHLTLKDFHAFLYWCVNTRKNSPYTRCRNIACLKSWFKYLYKKAGKLTGENVTLDLEMPKKPKKIPVHLTLEEAQRLLETIRDEQGRHTFRDFTIATLFLNCGLRLQELVNINLRDIKDDVIVIKGKGNKERSIPLNKTSLHVIDAYKRIRTKQITKYIRKKQPAKFKEPEALFLSSKLTRLHPVTIQEKFKEYFEDAELDVSKITIHKLRHTAATLMYQHGGVDIRILCDILGHASIATTQIYTHVSSEDVRKAMDNHPLSTSEKMKKILE